MPIALGQRRARVLFWTFFGLVLVGCNAVFQWVGFESASVVSLLYVVLLELSWLGFAYDCAELVLALMRPPCHPLKVARLEEFPRVALVCCTCDDVDGRALESLAQQQYPSAMAFVLDDSLDGSSQREVDESGLAVIRRADKRGYKAGNLNHWLKNFGDRFALLIVADADSILPPTFTAEMVSYAQHPSNDRVAIFESLIRPWNSDTLFTQWQQPAAVIQQSLALRVDNLIGTSLSVGHNNMYRIEAIRAAGGFQEDYVAEDHATCIEVIRSGRWSCKTVPVASYEKVPADVYAYCRRQARWAAQTFQLGALTLDGIPWSVRLRLLRGFHHYASYPALCCALILMLAASVGASGSTGDRGDSGWSAFTTLWLAVLYCPGILRYLVARRESIPARVYVRSVLFESTVFCASIGPVIEGLARSYWLRHVGFVPTGGRSECSLRSQLSIFALSGILGCLGIWAVLAGRIPVANAVWLVPLILSPAVLIAATRPDAGRK